MPMPHNYASSTYGGTSGAILQNPAVRVERVAVIGLGYVGLPLAVRARERGYRVMGVDVDTERVEKINRSIVPFEDERLEQSLPKADLPATADFSRIAEASIVILCVPTPVHHDSHMPDLSPVQDSVKALAPHLMEGALVIVESTVNPGVCEEIVIPLLVEGSGLTLGENLSVAHCPERINPGDPKWDVSNIPRVVGASDEAGLERALSFYRTIIDAPIKAMGNLAEAEAVKVVENSFRDINIAFVNELAMSFSRLGIDVVNVIDGAATKPFAFMAHYPGCGVGGHCIPVDPYYLIEYGRQNGFSHEFLSLARSINSRMPLYTVDLMVEALKSKGKNIRGATIALLGLAYKADIDDCRESPALAIAAELERRGAVVVKHDPFVPDLSDAPTIEAALVGADGALIATAHTAFKKLSPETLAKAGVDILIDGRNILDKGTFTDAHIHYRGIGR